MKRTMLCLVFALLMLPVGLHAGQKHPPSPSHPAALLQQLLHPDGSLNLPKGFTGSIDVSGWKMLTGHNGAPRFIPSSSPEDTLWEDRFGRRGTNGEVRCAVADGAGNLYIGGKFSGVGEIFATNVARWDGTRWSALGTGMQREGGDAYVAALVLDSEGNLYAGGCFETAGSGPAYNVAVWNGASWSPLGGGLTGFEDNTNGFTVNALAVTSANTLYAGGTFTHSGSIMLSNVGRWNGTTWEGLGVGVNGTVHSLTVGALDTVFVGGAFKVAGGNDTIQFLGAWSGSAWSSVGGTTYPKGSVSCVYWGPDAKLYVGSLENPGGGNASIVMRWDGTGWATVGPAFTGYVRALHIDGSGTLFMGGDFLGIGDVIVNSIARWNGAAWAAVGDGLESVWTLASMGNRLVIGGQCESIGQTVASNIATWDGAAYAPIYTAGKGEGIGAFGMLYSLAAGNDGNLYASGAFATAGGSVTNGIARWDGARWWPFAEISGSVVTWLLFDNSGNLYAGGQFDAIGGIEAKNVARWDGIQWSPLGPGLNGNVLTLAVDPHGTLYAGGEFDSSGGAAINGIAKWNGSSWQSVGGGLDDNASLVYSIVFDSAGTLYAGGDFSSIGGVAATCIAKWNDTLWSPVGAILPGVYPPIVIRLCFGPDGLLYAGGVFSIPGGYNFGVWNGTSWTGLGALDQYSLIYGLSFDREGRLYVGIMTFSTAPGSALRVWDGGSLTTPGSGIAMNEGSIMLVANVLDAGDGTIYAGGAFNTAGGKLSASIARLHKRYTVTATAGPGGTISDAGVRELSGGYPYFYTFTPDPGNSVDSIYIDGVYAGDSLSYRFGILNASHTIHVVFASGAHVINAASDGPGSIIPAGTVSVTNKGSQSFSFSTTIGYQLIHLIVDGDTLPPADHYLFTYVKAPHAITAVFDTISRYAVRYRTFTYDSLNVKKAIKKKNATTYFEFFVFNATLGTVNEINLLFSAEVAAVLESGGMSPAISKSTVQLTGALPSGQSFILKGRLAKPKPAIIKKLWLGPASGIVSFKDVQPMYQTYELPMPNAANVRDDLYLRWLQAQGGMLVGIARTDTTGISGWVQMKKSGDILKTLSDKTGLHTEASTGFVTIGGKPFVKAQGSLPPAKHNDRAFANLLTLKFNIYLSQLGITQPGLGEIRYVQEGSPFAGLLIGQIAAQGDSMMTLARWDRYAGHPELYASLDTALRQINAAFSAPFDTLCWSDSLKMKDAVPLIDAVAYLQPTDLPPVTVAPDRSPYSEAEEESEEPLPVEYALDQNYPNPFNPSTNFTYTLPDAGMVELKVFNVLGLEIATLVSGMKEPGDHRVAWNAAGMPSGIYFYRLDATSVSDPAKRFSQTRKMLLVK